MPAIEAQHAHSVLVVDDHDDSREALTALLRASGFDVREAASADDALTQLRQGLRPCVALLDLRMPDVDGWALWDRIRAEPDPTVARVPVAFVSGDLAQRERAHRAGIREFLAKPVDPDELVGVVARYCERT
jgi:CheY-like chemotaxis protein